MSLAGQVNLSGTTGDLFVEFDLEDGFQGTTINLLNVFITPYTREFVLTVTNSGAWCIFYGSNGTLPLSSTPIATITGLGLNPIQVVQIYFIADGVKVLGFDKARSYCALLADFRCGIISNVGSVQYDPAVVVGLPLTATNNVSFQQVFASLDVNNSTQAYNFITSSFGSSFYNANRTNATPVILCGVGISPLTTALIALAGAAVLFFLLTLFIWAGTKGYEIY